MTRRRGRRCKKLLDDLKDRRGYNHLKVEALDRTMWRNRFGRGVGPVVRLLNEWMILELEGVGEGYCSQSFESQILLNQNHHAFYYCDMYICSWIGRALHFLVLYHYSWGKIQLSLPWKWILNPMLLNDHMWQETRRKCGHFWLSSWKWQFT